MSREFFENEARSNKLIADRVDNLPEAKREELNMMVSRHDNNRGNDEYTE